ncbi:hypothetical protein [Urbifossiella limnaea]|uniref:Copper resistance protein D domain-containing protein n=1 Tax=Urbifossiella limnaea TaxID=2528023 RepID=A0A517XT62_9BACT|nr:hypothetical protein [Urbifossiella limnaea]QDU20687.1 hypothetical protein ETAA1_26440 [Urbifossiella limnaea]
MKLLEQVLFWVHGMSAAAWFGAIFYRFAVVDGKAARYFTDAADYERFCTHLAHGMRYVVTAGMLTCAASGFALAGVRWTPDSAGWLGLMAAKVVVQVAAVGLFVYVSYVHWPWRSMAAPDESARYRREGQRLAGAMVALSGLGFLLGQACRLY